MIRIPARDAIVRMRGVVIPQRINRTLENAARQRRGTGLRAGDHMLPAQLEYTTQSTNELIKRRNERIEKACHGRLNSQRLSITAYCPLRISEHTLAEANQIPTAEIK